MRRIGYSEPIEFVSGKLVPIRMKSDYYSPSATGSVSDGSYASRNQSDNSLFVCQTRIRRGNQGVIARRNYFAIKTYYQVSNSEASLAARARFMAVAAAVRTAYAVPETLASYTAQWRAQGGSLNQTLRKFIWDAEAAKLNP